MDRWIGNSGEDSVGIRKYVRDHKKTRVEEVFNAKTNKIGGKLSKEKRKVAQLREGVHKVDDKVNGISQGSISMINEKQHEVFISKKAWFVTNMCFVTSSQ